MIYTIGSASNDSNNDAPTSTPQHHGESLQHFNSSESDTTISSDGDQYFVELDLVRAHSALDMTGLESYAHSIFTDESSNTLENDHDVEPEAVHVNIIKTEQSAPAPSTMKQVILKQMQKVKHFSLSSSHAKLSRSQTESNLKRSDTSRSFKDPDLVTWDGPEDKANPHNWPKHRQWICMLLVSMFTFISPMASTMIAPALPTIAAEFNIRTAVEEMFVMAIFLLAYAVGPFLWGPLSEVFGRVKVLQCANLIFLGFNTACGFAGSKEQMMTFRFLSGIGGSAPQAIGGGVLVDVFKAEERGAGIAVYSLMPFISPAIAPIMGAYLTQYTTWRWVFWTTSIFDISVQIVCVFLLRETHAPAILHAKAKRLIKETGNGNLHTKWQGPDHTMREILTKALVRPFIMLATQPALQAMALFRAYQYGLMYLALATFPMVFEDSYGMSVGTASLNYLSLGLGFVIGLQISGFLQDKIYQFCKIHRINPSAPIFSLSTWQILFRSISSNDPAFRPSNIIPQSTMPYTVTAIPRKPLSPTAVSTTSPALIRIPTSKSLAARHSENDPSLGLPEFRLPLTLPFSILIAIGLFVYGFSAAAHTHWIVPNIGACIFAIGLVICFNCAQAYVIDTYTTYAASATGAAAFVRTMAGFGFPLFAPRMFAVLGIGWGNGLLGFICLGLGSVVPVLLWRWGAWLRARSTYCAG